MILCGFDWYCMRDCQNLCWVFRPHSHRYFNFRVVEHKEVSLTWTAVMAVEDSYYLTWFLASSEERHQESGVWRMLIRIFIMISTYIINHPVAFSLPSDSKNQRSCLMKLKGSLEKLQRRFLWSLKRHICREQFSHLFPAKAGGGFRTHLVVWYRGFP